MSGKALTKDAKCRSLGFVNNPPRGYFRTVKTCYDGKKKPCKPCVRVALGNDIPGMVPDDIIAYDTVLEDKFNMYNTTTNVFTIPKAGVYAIDATLCLTNFGSAPLIFTGILLLVDANSLGTKSFQYVSATNQFTSAVLHVELVLAAGSSLKFTFSQVGSTATALGGLTDDGQARTTWATIRRIK